MINIGVAHLVVCFVATVLIVQSVVCGLVFIREHDGDRWWAMVVSVASAGGAWALIRLML